MTTNDLWKQINPFLTRVQAQSHANPNPSPRTNKKCIVSLRNQTIQCV